jgi:hypothetical protein
MYTSFVCIYVFKTVIKELNLMFNIKENAQGMKGETIIVQNCI